MIHNVILANIILLVQYAVGSLVPLLLMPHIVSVIGLAEYGHIAVLLAWGNYGAVVVQYAFQLTGPERLARLAPNGGCGCVPHISIESPAAVFVDITLAKILLLAVVLPLMALLTIVLMPLKSSSPFAWVLLFASPVAIGVNSVWFLQSQDRFLQVCTLAIIGSILNLAIGFSFISSDDIQSSVNFAVLVTIFGPMFSGFGTMLLAIFSIENFSCNLSVARAIDVLKQGKYLFVSQFISVFYSASGPIIINYFLDAQAAGAYSITERIMGALMTAALLTHTAAYPRLAHAYVVDRNTYRRLLRFVVLSYLGVTTIIALVVLWFWETVIKFIYGGVSDSGHDALLFTGLMWLISGIFGPALTGYLTVSGQSQKVWPITLAILFSTIILGLPGVIFLGEEGWMMALVLSQMVIILMAIKYWKTGHVDR